MNGEVLSWRLKTSRQELIISILEYTRTQIGYIHQLVIKIGSIEGSTNPEFKFLLVKRSDLKFLVVFAVKTQICWDRHAHIDIGVSI